MHLLVLQYRKICIKSTVDIACEHVLHSLKAVFRVIFVKSFIVRKPVCELNVYRWKAGFHKFKIYKKSSCSAIAIDKRMYSFELYMESCKLCYNMVAALLIVYKKLFHHGTDKVRLHRFMLCSHDSNGNSAVYAAVIFFIRKNQIMNLFYDALCQRSVFFD